MEPRTVRTSTILISVGERTEIYRSLEQVPRSLRRRLEETTAGTNSGTILIADRRGRQEILKALNRRGNVISRPIAARRRRLAWVDLDTIRRWGLILLPGAVGLVAWLLASQQ